MESYSFHNDPHLSLVDKIRILRRVEEVEAAQASGEPQKAPIRIEDYVAEQQEQEGGQDA